ncbi:Dcp1p-Dcp2p decapping enzyme complex alpha subunit [Podila horticola]|nr:Dcp1p-Dcp2p decapping enzyme complex alpha subunit [Podila horticola]
MPADSIIPTIPGVPVNHRDENMLRQRICNAIGLHGGNRSQQAHGTTCQEKGSQNNIVSHRSNSTGAQPVSFTRLTLKELASEDYFVSEKSDGVRVLLYCVVGEDGKQSVYLVDRKNKFSYVQELVFPAPGNQGLLHETVVDGELVTDTEADGQQLVRYLAFDLLVTNGQSIIDKPLGSRLARLQNEFITPYRQMLQNPNVKLAPQPFRVSLKQMELSYGIDKMFYEVIPHLKHGNDGLIFTSAVAPYIPSTNTKMLKWKPPSENTIDFRLTLESTSNHKPLFVLHEWLGGQNYSRFGQLTVPDDLWRQWQSTSTELQNRVVEVNYSPSDNTWRFFRFRDDKEHGNHSSVVQKVVQSIQDGVEREELRQAAPHIRAAWKERARIQQMQQQQQHQF